MQLFNALARAFRRKAHTYATIHVLIDMCSIGNHALNNAFVLIARVDYF